jgi:hypothetical protein
LPLVFATVVVVEASVVVPDKTVKALIPEVGVVMNVIVVFDICITGPLPETHVEPFHHASLPKWANCTPPNDPALTNALFVDVPTL